jgi:type VI protein secretion system component VasF
MGMMKGSRVDRLIGWWCALAVGATLPRQGDEHGDGRRDKRRDERGDVPGWVLVTIMTAGMVTMLWRFAGPQLQQMLADALAQVRG